MSMSRIRKSARVVLSLVLALLVLGVAPQTPAPAAEGGTIALKAPPFVASAQEGTDVAPMGFPADEAGISAYFKSASSITLADVKSVFRVIEAQTADYIIGSVAVAGYPELYDVHLYVHRDGWFLAYYLKSDPAAKMADIVNYRGQNIGTLFEKTLYLAAIGAGVPFSGATFYDFRYPNATNLMLVGEAFANPDTDNTFTVQLPLNFAYYERSWSLYDGGGDWYFVVDGVRQVPTAGSNPYYGMLTADKFLPDMVHTIAVDNWGVLGLVYRVQ